MSFSNAERLEMKTNPELMPHHSHGEPDLVIASAGNKSKGEVTAVDPKTGGEKGTKLARFDLIPVRALWELAEHFGKCGGDGDKIPPKYGDRNWERGYKWSFSYSAAQRHLNAFWDGEDIDALCKTKHVICAAWHCFVLATFMSLGLGTDDRPTTVANKGSK